MNGSSFRGSVISLILLCLVGCDPPSLPPEPPPPVNELEPFVYLEGSDVNVLNIWRNENANLRAVGFDSVTGNDQRIYGFLIRYEKAPGSSRQVFVYEGRKHDYYVQDLDEIAKKYPAKRIVDFCYTNGGFIYCLEDILEPYLPSDK